MGVDTVIAADFTAKHPRWRVDAAGCFAIVDSSGRDVTPRGRKARAIIAYLSLNRGEHVLRERLTELLWGDRGEPQARASLRQSLLEIRHCCKGLVSADREHLWIDRSRLEELPDEQDARCGAELFEDLGGITPEFDDWLRCERSRHADSRWKSLEAEVRRLLAGDAGEMAIPLIERMRQIDPYNEDWLRLAMRAECQSGHPAAIRTRFREMGDLLEQELGVSLSPQTRALHDELLAELAGPASSAVRAADLPEGADAPGPATGAEAGIWRRPIVLLTAVAALAGTVGISQSTQSASAVAPRIAVLPFAASAGVDPVLAEGLSDELTAQLARRDGLRVVGRMSSAQFRGGAADLRKAGRSLRADYLVEGKVSEAGGETRVLVSLVNGDDGSIVWARRFSGRSRDLQPIPTAIGSAVGRSIGAGVAPAVQPARIPEAYAFYIRAKSLIRSRDRLDIPKAIELLRQAIRLDPHFAGAWAQLGAATRLSFQSSVEINHGSASPVRISSREAVARALRLDPNLAEAHAIMAMIEDWSPRGRAHLQRALQLDPNDIQTRYWWSAALTSQGHFDRSGEILREVVALDPLWRLAVSEAAKSSFQNGERAVARQYLAAIKLGDPEAAADIEAGLVFLEGDYSRVLQLGFGEGEASSDWARFFGEQALFGLGFEQEAMLVAKADPSLRAILVGNPPPLPELLRYLESYEGTGLSMVFDYALWGLARDRRWSYIAALHDSKFGDFDIVKSTDPGSRWRRVEIGPILALALKMERRDREAVRLALRVGEDREVMLRNRQVPMDMLVMIAGAEALLGRRDDALDHLEQAFARGWRMDLWNPIPPIGENPLYATLRDDPRFRKLAAVQQAHFAKERREITELGIL